MIISNENAVKRLSSPINLINSLREPKKNNSMSLFGVERVSQETKQVETLEVITTFNPFETTTNIPLESTSHPQNKTLQPPVEATEPQPTIDKLLNNNESQIKLGLAHDNALELLTKSISLMKLKLDNIKPDKLPSVISATAKVVEGIRRERNEADKNDKDRDVHYHFYTPVQKRISDYEVIDVP